MPVNGNGVAYPQSLVKPALKQLDVTKQAQFNLSGQTQSQTGAAVGAIITSIGGIVAVAFPVAGAIIAALGALTSLAFKLFGNNWHTSTQVRWLIKDYQWYVLGDVTATSNNHVNENLVYDAQAWFQAYLGVYCYDNVRPHALRGENYGGVSFGVNPTYTDRANKYLEISNCVYPLSQVIVAAEAADLMSLPSSNSPGAWRDFPTAAYWYDNLSAADIAALETNDTKNQLLEGYTIGDQNNMGSGFSGLWAKVVLAICAFFLLPKLFKSRKK